MSRKRVMLSFRTDSPQHMKAYSTIMCIPARNRSETIIQLINKQAEIEQQIYNAVTRALRDYQPTLAKNAETKAEQIPQDMLDFVFSL